MDNKFYVAVTAIIIKDNKVLITRRNKEKKKWPGKWTVPGGRVEVQDFLGTPTEINNQWYHVLENAVKREVKEEVGLAIDKVKYLCNIAIPDTVIISYMAEYLDGEVVLQKEETDAYEWITAEECRHFDLIDGLQSEIEDALYNASPSSLEGRG